MSCPAVSYGFIGLGVMGYPMALNLRRKIPAESKLHVCELHGERLKRFVEEAGTNVYEATSPKSVAENAVSQMSRGNVAKACLAYKYFSKDIIFTSLPAGEHVKGVFGNPESGLLAAKPEGKLFIETSTINTAISLEIGELVAKAHAGDFLDAPVSGGPNGANAGTLTFMVGGPEEVFNRALPILETMGKEENLFYCGKAGSGLATKQINNYLSGVCIVGVSEAMDMGVKYGLDPKRLSDVINVSTGRCYNSLEQNPIKGVVPTSAASKNFKGGFSIELATGVIRLAVELGKQVGSNTLVADKIVEAFETASLDERCRGKDCRSLYKWLADIR